MSEGRWNQDVLQPLLASIEDLFGLPRLGEAKTVTTTFDKKIYTP